MTGIKLTGCPDCDKSLLETKDLCLKHRLEMIEAQMFYWTNCREKVLIEWIKKSNELEKEQNVKSSD